MGCGKDLGIGLDMNLRDEIDLLGSFLLFSRLVLIYR